MDAHSLDPDSDTARLERHRRLNNFGFAPHPDVVRRNNLPLEAALIVAQALLEIDQVNATGEAKSLTLEEVKAAAANASGLLRNALSMLDPKMQAPQTLALTRKEPDVKVHGYLENASDIENPRALVLWDDVADRVEWLEQGIAEWRAYAVEYGNQFELAKRAVESMQKEMKNTPQYERLKA